MNWYLSVLRQYAVFDGRARRKEYWMFSLFSGIFSVVLSCLDLAIGLSVLGTLYSLAVLLPVLAVSVRRLHDIGKSGWMLLVAFIPIAGLFWLLVLLCTDGEPGENAYGQNPKEMTGTSSNKEDVLDDF